MRTYVLPTDWPDRSPRTLLCVDDFWRDRDPGKGLPIDTSVDERVPLGNFTGPDSFYLSVIVRTSNNDLIILAREPNGSRLSVTDLSGACSALGRRWKWRSLDESPFVSVAEGNELTAESGHLAYEGSFSVAGKQYGPLEQVMAVRRYSDTTQEVIEQRAASPWGPETNGASLWWEARAMQETVDREITVWARNNQEQTDGPYLAAS